MQKKKDEMACLVSLQLGKKQLKIIALLTVSFFIFLCGLSVFLADYLCSLRIDALKRDQLIALALHEQAYIKLNKDLKDTVISGEEDSQEALKLAFGKVSIGIRKIDGVYSGILEEQKKKTLDSMYTDLEVKTKYQEALQSIKLGKYRQAYDLLCFVIKEQNENLDARYYRAYSLFNVNTSDRNQYGFIQKELNFVLKNGYANPEINRILTFIESENKIMKQEIK